MHGLYNGRLGATCSVFMVCESVAKFDILALFLRVAKIKAFLAEISRQGLFLPRDKAEVLTQLCGIIKGSSMCRVGPQGEVSPSET